MKRRAEFVSSILSEDLRLEKEFVTVPQESKHRNTTFHARELQQQQTKNTEINALFSK